MLDYVSTWIGDGLADSNEGKNMLRYFLSGFDSF